jgi:hypothetical protein
MEMYLDMLAEKGFDVPEGRNQFVFTGLVGIFLKGGRRRTGHIAGCCGYSRNLVSPEMDPSVVLFRRVRSSRKKNKIAPCLRTPSVNYYLP